MILAVALLCFGSHFSNSLYQGLATGLSGLWGWIFCFSAATIHYSQLGHSAVNANRTWKFFGILIMTYIASMVVSIKFGEWLSNIRNRNHFIKNQNHHKFVFFDILFLIMMIGASAACVPLLMNLRLFYKAVSLYNLVPIALWGVPVLFIILFYYDPGFSESINAWFCAAMTTAFTVLVLWFGHVGGAGAVIGWICLAFVALVFIGFICSEIDTGLSWITSGLLFVIFIVGAYVDILVLDTGVSSIGVGVHWWMAAPCLITMVVAMGITLKELAGY